MAEREPLLSEIDKVALQDAILAANSVEEDLIRAEQAGIDLSAQRQRLEQGRQKARQILQAFFPNG